MGTATGDNYDDSANYGDSSKSGFGSGAHTGASTPGYRRDGGE